MSGHFGLRCGTDLLKACDGRGWNRALVDDLLIRPIELRELAAAAGLRERMTRELSATGSPPDNPGWHIAFERFYATRIADGSAATFVIADGDTLVAMASVYRLINHRSEIFAQPSAYISNVYVVPELRRRGFASRLTQACVAWARDQGCVVARLRSSQVGRPVYTALGFTQSDELELPLGTPPPAEPRR
ncbi:MAG TPA: GNAT family N-acetyltransferase [Candidatus Eremiobacteraceae bacterium]|nr:GNAT family N-acetyltransferase [Candidatus Eremiobacteraceae bacterium]